MSDDIYTPAISRETRLRILVSIYAYAYEIMADPLVSDGQFDEIAREININVDTLRPDLDAFFRAQFDPCTGSWIYRHPELSSVARMHSEMVLRQKDSTLEKGETT